MFLRTMSLCAAVAFAAACATGSSDTRISRPAETTDQQEMMKRMEELGTPGAAHKRLDPIIGTFKSTNRMRMGPDAPEEVTDGSVTNSWILDGRFLRMDETGSFQGKPFSGLGLIGFDNASQKYQSVWASSMCTTLQPAAEGTANANGNVITLSRTYTDPMSGQTKTTREVLTIIDRNRHTFEWFEPGPDGREYRMISAEYSRTR